MGAAFAFLGLRFLLIWIMFILPVVLAWRFCTAWPLLSPVAGMISNMPASSFGVCSILARTHGFQPGRSGFDSRQTPFPTLSLLPLTLSRPPYTFQLVSRN